MKTIAERARLAAWQIFEEIGLSQHSVDRVSEIITEKMLDQKAIDIDKAVLIDRNRSLRGDFFNKPTQYWFLNCEPTYGKLFQKPSIHKHIASGKPGIQGGICSEDRSMISPDYARNFICDFILGKPQPEICPTLFDAM